MGCEKTRPGGHTDIAAGTRFLRTPGDDDSRNVASVQEASDALPGLKAGGA